MQVSPTVPRSSKLEVGDVHVGFTVVWNAFQCPHRVERGNVVAWQPKVVSVQVNGMWQVEHFVNFG
jgi:hypothetical protein